MIREPLSHWIGLDWTGQPNPNYGILKCGTFYWWRSAGSAWAPLASCLFSPIKSPTSSRPSTCQGLPREYHTISEEATIQMLLLMDAVRSEPRYHRAKAVAKAIAGMDHCEAAWSYAHHGNRSRPRRVMRALALIHG